MELQLKYHKNIWDKFLLGDLHIFKVTGWPSFQLTLLRPVCLNQNNHMTQEQQLFFHKVMGNLAGMCHHHVRGTAANPLTSRSRSGNMLKSCTMKIPQWLQWEQWWQQDIARGMWEKTQINCICLLNLLTPLAGEELSYHAQLTLQMTKQTGGQGRHQERQSRGKDIDLRPWED